MKINWACGMFECTTNFWDARIGKKLKFMTFQAKPVWIIVIFIHTLYVNLVLEKFQR